MNIKVCGITRLEDAQLAVDLGAWALGFIFYEKSPRYILPEKVAQIVKALGNRARFTGVFVNSTLAEINATTKLAGLSLVQLHGEETPEFCAGLTTEVIKAVRPRSQADIDAITRYKTVRTFLVDAAVEGQYGGTGQLANWALAKAALAHGQVLLSGGLKPENVAEAVKTVAPTGIDVSSGVEDAPGIKNADKLRKFFHNARSGAVK